jgi:hypothetical protein
MEVKYLNLMFEENCKTIGNYDKLLVKSKWYRPIICDENKYIIFIVE